MVIDAVPLTTHGASADERGDEVTTEVESPAAAAEVAPSGRALAARVFELYGELPSYRAMLDREGADGPADVAIVGDEEAVTTAVQALFDAGATDVWAAVFPVGADRRASRERTRQLLGELVAA